MAAKNKSNTSKTAHVMNLLSKSLPIQAEPADGASVAPDAASAPSSAPVSPSSDRASGASSKAAESPNAPVTPGAVAPPASSPASDGNGTAAGNGPVGPDVPTAQQPPAYPPSPKEENVSVPPMIINMEQEAAISDTIKNALEAALNDALKETPAITPSPPPGYVPLVPPTPHAAPEQPPEPPPESSPAPESPTCFIPPNLPSSEEFPEIFDLPSDMAEAEPEDLPLPEQSSSSDHDMGREDPTSLHAGPEEAVPNDEAAARTAFDEAEQREAEKTSDGGDGSKEEEASAASDSPAAVSSPDGEPYIYANIMKLMVDEKAEQYSKMFGLCGCSHCMADIKAIALNNLPPKYVVMKASEQQIRMAMYESEFGGTVSAQTLRACKEVLEHPRHPIQNNSLFQAARDKLF